MLCFPSSLEALDLGPSCVVSNLATLVASLPNSVAVDPVNPRGPCICKPKEARNRPPRPRQAARFLLGRASAHQGMLALPRSHGAVLAAFLQHTPPTH